ncbi:MAG: LuxR C-terminal-related transcriptional regulator [Adlercreutzia equolifaciens]
MGPSSSTRYAHGKLASRRAECCRRLARSSGLTDREAEILGVPSRRKEAEGLSEMLVVSITTVWSHARAIYAKTGVHSHGELMHLLDEK